MLLRSRLSGVRLSAINGHHRCVLVVVEEKDTRGSSIHGRESRYLPLRSCTLLESQQQRDRASRLVFASACAILSSDVRELLFSFLRVEDA
jgi:hypothetical protein